MTRTDLADLSPLAQLRAPRLPRRLVQLAAGLVLYGWSMSMMIVAALGLNPWDVLHDGIVTQTGLRFGTVVIVVGLVVLLLWIPLRQLPGLGTIANAIVIGLVTNVALAVMSTPDSLAERGVLLVLGIVLNALGGALYIGSQLGAGPRDGLMTGLVFRTGRSVRLVRTSLEVTVLAIGFLLGGQVGIGTVLYAVSIGPLVQAMLPWVTVDIGHGTVEPEGEEGR